MMNNTCTPSRLFLIAALAVVMPLTHGCQSFGTRRPAPTQIDRLMQVYPELAGGRMLVIGDFEDAKHMELVHLDAASDRASCVLDAKKGRPETGRGCLLFTATSLDDAVVIDNKRASNWYLKRDWRDYDLLMMAINVPARGVSAEIAVSGGTASKRYSTQASIALESGWNVLRLDLAEIGERIPMDDVREIRIGVSGLTKPTPIAIDDILLAGNREDLLGSSSADATGLYVQRVGRRLRVGARGPGGGFELDFGRGQIVAWHNLTADPFRLHNLVRGTSLGPMPVILGTPAGEESDFSFLGAAVVAHQRVVEMNAVRVVLEAEWRFVDDARARQVGLDDRPFHRWRYTIYPNGDVYVAVEATRRTPTWAGAELGVAVFLSASKADGVQTSVSHVAIDDTPNGGGAAFGFASVASADAHLLFAVDPDGATLNVTRSAEAVASAGGARVALVASRADGGSDKGDVETWTCHLVLGSGALTDADAAARVRGFLAPGGIRVAVGAVSNAGGRRPEATGFDRRSGCYSLKPDRDRVLFVVGAADRSLSAQAFHIAGSAGFDAWVYVNHLIYDAIARDANGDVIFQLPGPIDKPTRVEVILRRSE